ncbi:SDR family NAD(P)-dependent oxidoreductase [Bradyrhizobium sp.]|uniref:SDR family NAD(P)-dependent oxidoreductase n=1 Tax=Bradyrhizobium sp. TaxID=376 RepID=UPI0039E61D22
MPNFDLSGRRALVTGGSKGIGLGAARVLAAAGAHVTIVARRADDVAAAAEAINTSDGIAEGLCLDVTDVAAVADHVARSLPYQILVNSAGTNVPGPFVDVSPDRFDLVMGLNVRASYFVTQAVARRLIASGMSGSIINVSSQMGHVGASNRTIYCASKWALEGLTKALAVELASARIRINTICPTFIETPMTAPFFADSQFRASVLSKIKLGRLGTVDDLAGGFLFLASDASSLMTGASLVIDGGWTAE